MILLPLLNVQIPENANMFFKTLMSIAAFEIIPTEILYSRFSNVEGIPLSEEFEELGFEHHLILDNFGTLGVVFVSLPIAYMLNGIFTPYRKSFCDCFKRLQKRISR